MTSPDCCDWREYDVIDLAHSALFLFSVIVTTLLVFVLARLLLLGFDVNSVLVLVYCFAGTVKLCVCDYYATISLSI